MRLMHLMHPKNKLIKIKIESTAPTVQCDVVEAGWMTKPGGACRWSAGSLNRPYGSSWIDRDSNVLIVVTEGPMMWFES